MPWLSLEEFRYLSATEGRETEQLSAKSRNFLAAHKAKALQEANDLVSLCDDKRIQIIYPEHPSYPEGCYELEDAPLFLTLDGDWPTIPSVAIVGSREPSRLSVDWLSTNLPLVYEKIKLLVVSGGARGIDQTAHLAAARSGKPTLVFLPSGLCNFYPRDLKRYKDIILECGGGFVSELPPYAEMKKFYFIKRNRLIVASSDVVFVAEARRKSGSILTANIAAGMNKALCTLPATPSMACAQGSLDLIFNGSQVLRDHLDLISLISSSSKRALV